MQAVVAYGCLVRTGLINMPDAELEVHPMLIQFFDRAVYYGTLAYDNAGPQDSARTASRVRVGDKNCRDQFAWWLG
jgi:hypothetical protein